MSAMEKKPVVQSSHITVKVKSQDDKCVFFRIKKDVVLRTMMKAFSEQIGEEMTILRFHFDGEKIKADQTPKELELEDGDEIDVFF